jgi:hypothetical protein
MLVWIKGTQDAHKLNGFLSKWPFLALGSNDTLEKLQKLRIL